LDEVKGGESSLKLVLAGLNLPSKQEMLYSNYRLFPNPHGVGFLQKAVWRVQGGLFLSEVSVSARDLRAGVRQQIAKIAVIRKPKADGLLWQGSKI